MPKIKLSPRTSWVNGRGENVNIAGYAKRDPVDGQDIFWSIQGDHYTEDGRFVSMRRTGRTDESGWAIYETVLLDYGKGSSIAAQRTDKESVEWWIDVLDRPEDRIPWRKRKNAANR